MSEPADIAVVEAHPTNSGRFTVPAGLVNGLKWSTVGGLLGSGLLFTTNVAAGRLLGPTQYGMAAFVLLIAQLFTLFAGMGLDVAASRYAASVKTPHERARVVSTALMLLAPAVVVTVGLGLLISAVPAWGQRDSLVAAGVVLGATLALRSFADRLSAAMRWFRFQAVGRAIEGVVALLVLLTVVALGYDGHGALVIALLSGAGAVTVFLLARIVRGWRRADVHRATASSLMRYSAIAIVHAVTPLGFVFADKFVIGVELGDATLGVYSAYLTGSFLIVAQILAITTNVLYPSVAALDDKTGAYRRIARLRRIGIIPATGAMFVVVTIVLAAYGDAFRYQVDLALLAAAWSALLLFNGMLTVLPITHSERSYLLTALLQGVRSVLFVGYLVAMIVTSDLSLEAVFVGLVLLELVDTACLEFITRRHVIGGARAT